MDIDEVLQQQAKVVDHASGDDIYYMTGSISADPEGTAFRLYRDPENTRSCLLIKKQDVIGGVHALTDLERTQKGFVRDNVFRIGLKHGTTVKCITTTIAKIGETLSVAAPRSPQLAGKCVHASDCTHHCCTYASDGECYCDTCCLA